MGFKFATNLFLEVAELNRFSKFIDTDGFRKNILENSVNFGLIKSNKDKTFANARVQRDTDTISGQKTVKINEVHAIDSNGHFIYSAPLTGIGLTNDNNWYWLKMRYQYTNVELGTVSIAINGDLVGVGTKFTEVLRGMPNFPATIKLTDAVHNVLEYQVLEVIDDTHAILANPATNTSGIAEFAAETGLHYAVVGTFTPGVVAPSGDKYPFQYDSMYYELVQETALNTRPAFVPGIEFFLTRVKVNGSSVIIQDKRIDYWETKGSELNIAIDRNPNPLVGVEAVKWQTNFNPSDKNLVEVSWGMRSDNWTVNSDQNILTLNSGLGGAFKDVNDFSDGDFDGWRVYTDNGKYSYVIDSVKQGGAINLFLDVLDVDNYSLDGGASFISQQVLIVPDCEEVEFYCDANGTYTATTGGVTTSTPIAAKNCSEKFTFPVNTPVGIMDLECYNNAWCLYNIQYRYKSYKEYTEYAPIPSDTVVGYLTEVSFTVNGELVPLVNQVRYPYSALPTAGYIRLNLCPWAYSNFKTKVDKGDLIGVNVVTNLSTQVTNLTVGVDKNYQYIAGNISISQDTYINLNPGLVDGNEFRIHLDCTGINLGGKNIFIVENYNSGTFNIIKTIKVGDVFEMLNSEKGVVFDLVYTGSKWAMYANYNTGTPFEIKSLDGVVANLFDVATGMGRVKGTYGLCLCDSVRTINGVNIPNLSGRFLEGQGAYTDASGAYNYAVGNTGGEAKHKLTTAEIPAHSHTLNTFGGALAQDGNSGNPNTTPVNPKTVADTTGSTGGDGFHENRPPYYALIFAKKTY